MPEGPEIRRAADRIGKVLVGRPLDGVRLVHPSIEAFEAALSDTRVVGVTTRGKAMLTRFDAGLTLYSHNQLYGRWTVQLRSTEVKWSRAMRVEFLVGRKAVRLWSATDLAVLPTDQEHTHPFLARLGPDVLDPAVDAALLAERLASRACRNRKAAHLMLDQHAFAGLGNYLRSEILFVAGVHPDDRPADLDPERIGRWADAIKRTTVRAYEAKGVTVDDATAARGRAAGEPRRRWRHHAFCRNELPCLSCATPIVRRRYGSRRLDFCPTCQPARRPARGEFEAG